MNKLFIVMLAIFSLNASAKTIKLFSTWDLWSQITPSFDINANLGRAWVNLSIDNSPNDPDSSAWDERIRIEGLFYEPMTKEILFQDEKGKQTVCAATKTRGRGIFKNTSLINTKTCKFTKTFEVKNVDDGFHITKRKYQVINLVIQD